MHKANAASSIAILASPTVSVHVASAKPDISPTRRPNNRAPRNTVSTTSSSSATADGSLTANEFTPNTRMLAACSQYTRGGLSKNGSPLHVGTT